MRIVLVNPPSPWLIEPNQFPPLHLMYLGTVLQKGHDIKICDMEESLPKADAYGFSATTPQYPYALDLAKNIKEYKVVGGAHASAIPIECGNDFDAVVVGEAELLINNIFNQKSKGIVRCPNPNHLQIPKVNRSLVNIHNYNYPIGKDMIPATTIITARGCPFSCAFCSEPKQVRFHPLNTVLEEIKEIHELGFEGILFLDDIFTINTERCIRISKECKKYRIKYRCYARPYLKEDLIQKMAENGCVEIGMGIESASQRILNLNQKGTTVENNRKTIELCKKYGIAVNAFIMIGLPGETRETVEETKKFILETKPEKFGYSVFMPYPGSPIYNNPEKFNIKIHPLNYRKMWTKGRKGEYECFVETEELTRSEIITLHENVYKELSEQLNWRRDWSK